MVKIAFDPEFRKAFGKIKDSALKVKILKHIMKIKEDPSIGKPMMYVRKGTREVYVKPYRLAYAVEGDTLIILEFYHKDEQ
jgi:mRNA-degrading endonuclease RelE of RelBE toxin-antitoxin system